MKKIMFIVPSLRGGGAQKVMVTLLKHLDRNKFDATLVLLAREGKYRNEVPVDVKIYDLDTNRVRHSIFSLLKLIRKIKPDVILSTQGHLNLAIIALKPFIGKKTKVIVREANTVSEELKLSKRAWFGKLLYKVFYKKADLVICQSTYMLIDLLKNFHVPKKKLVQIYNPVELNRINYLANKEQNPFLSTKSSVNIIALGRLTHQKGFDRLIESIPRLLKIKPNAKVWIIGEGELKEELQKKRDELGLSDKVNFVDFQKNPYNWLKNADLFVLSSYYEGLPNVLLEAIACDCPVIALQHPGGTGEIMEITRQENRYPSHLDWEENWFNRPTNHTKMLLSEVFEATKIVKKYENYF